MDLIGTPLEASSTYFRLGTIDTYALCYQATGSIDLVTQGSLMLNVVAATESNRITALSPTSASSSFDTSITLTGTVTAGDKILWERAGHVAYSAL